MRLVPQVYINSSELRIRLGKSIQDERGRGEGGGGVGGGWAGGAFGVWGSRKREFPKIGDPNIVR